MIKSVLCVVLWTQQHGPIETRQTRREFSTDLLVLQGELREGEGSPLQP